MTKLTLLIMKTLYAKAGLLIFTLILSSLLYADTTLIGYWKLNDSGGVIDSSANGWSDFSGSASGYAGSQNPTNLRWRLATASAQWPRREDAAFLSHNDHMWIISGDAGGSPHPNDVWSSDNGTNWTLATDTAPWIGRRDFVGLVHDEKMWIISGFSYPYVRLGDVWCSSNGTNWTQATGEAPWSARGQSSGVVYDGKMWIFGGLDDSVNKNDVWNSTDGSNWTCVTTGAPWAARRGHASVVYDDKMWIMSGYGSGGLKNDVWWSTDGTNWTEATSSAEWTPRQYIGIAAYDGAMWMTGGGLDGSWEANDVWYSTNGATWICDTEHASWTSRYGQGLLIHKDRMWLAGGADINTGQRLGDVWYADEPSLIPDPPQNVQASAGDYTDKVAVTWDTSTDAAKYVVYRNTTDTTNGAIDISGEITATMYDDMTASPCEIYYYWVKSGSSNGWSDFSYSDSGYVKTPSPTGINASDGTYTSKVEITWNSSYYATNDLIGYWKLNNSSTILDSSINGWTATNKGATFSSLGRLNGAYYFDGTTDIRLNAPVLTNLPVTIELWANAEGTQPAGVAGYYTIINNDKFGSGGHGIGINNNRGVYLNRRGDCLQGWTTGCMLPSGVWTHIAAVLEATQITLYTNGILYNTWSHSSTEGLSRGELFTRIGRRNEGSTDRFQGYLDEIRVWRGVRSGEEIASHFDNELSSSEYKYMVYRNTIDNNSSASDISGEITNASYDDITAIPGYTYYYWVKSKCNNIWSDFSGSDSGYAGSQNQTNLKWHLATASASWPRREDSAFLTHNDRMWIISGDAGGSPHPNDVWSSDNGTNWTLATDTAPWIGRRDFVGLVHDEKMWIISGFSYPYVRLGDVWCSSNGTNWTQATGEAPWSARGQSSGVVYDGKMWIFGGLDDSVNKNDVWNSTDGSNWTCVTTGASWAARRGHASVVYDGKMWIMGGYGSGGLKNDVWWSTDGSNWTETTNSAGWNPRQFLGVAAYNGVMWITGGGLDSSWEANDVWFSANGATWICDTEHAPWTSRYGHGLLVHKSRMWLAGGADINTGQRLGDVWYADDPSLLPKPPQNIQASAGDYTNKVTITWNSSTNDTKYVVYRNTVDDSSLAVNISGEITTNFFENTAATSGQLYFYWVKAGNATGWSVFSDSDSGYAGSITALPILSPTLLEFSTNYITKFVTLGNDGSASYSFDAVVSGGSPWLDVSPIHGTVSVQNVSLAVTVDRSSLSAGSYEGYVDVTPSVGDAYTVTARVEVTVENSVVAEANGPYSVNQGSAVSLTSVGSKGNELLYKWEIGLDFSTSYSADNFDYSYTNTFVPGDYTVILYVQDTNSPPNTASDSTLLTVNNVSPSVDIGGPYVGEINSNIIFTAIVSDPGILDTHEFRWNFDGDETWDIDWTNLSTVSYAYGAGGNYAAVCGVRDNHGGSGSDIASVLIEAENMPPVAQAVIQGTTLTETNLPGLNYTVTLDGSGSYDPDTKPNPTLYFDWREDVNNPAKPVIVESNRHNSIVITSPLTKAGEYKFHLVVFDGEFNSELVTLTVRVPGWSGQVICEGFSEKVPLWGVEVQVTNAFRGQLDSDRTDDKGEFLVDAGVGYQIAKLSRRSDTETEIINIDADGECMKNIYFLPTYYIYAGQVVTGSPGNFVGLPYAQTEILIGKGLSALSDAVGAFGYGMVPESWPLDSEKIKVRFQKQGFKSMVREILLNMNKNSEFIALEPSTGNVQIQGTILSEISGLPVADVELDFGNSWTATSDSNGNYGPVEIPEGDYIVELTKTGFDSTLHEISSLSAGTQNIDLVINGGEVSVYGQIVDNEGNPVTNATIELVEETAGSEQRAVSSDLWSVGSGTTATGAGYYDVTIAKGERTYIVSSPDFESVEVTLDIDGHTKQDIILPIPEPFLIVNCYLLIVIYHLRKRGK